MNLDESNGTLYNRKIVIILIFCIHVCTFFVIINFKIVKTTHKLLKSTEHCNLRTPTLQNTRDHMSHITRKMLSTYAKTKRGTVDQSLHS